jgi:hypothetical protein
VSGLSHIPELIFKEIIVKKGVSIFEKLPKLLKFKL